MTSLQDGDVQCYAKNEDVPYVHLDVLGKGSSGLVEKVQHKGTKELFARKLFPVPRRKQADQEAVFRNELTVIRRLCTHHHFIRVHAAYKTKQYFGIILQPVADGGDLAAFLDMYGDSQEAARGLESANAQLHDMQSVLERAFGCLASGLAFMHAQRIRHKDIKPQNILVHRGTVLFTDFGYSLDSSNHSNSATEGRPSFLTKRYSAPEVLRYDKRDSLSDVWSLGCVFLELFSALSPSFSIDAVACFAEDMERLQAPLKSLRMTSRMHWIPDLIIDMTMQEASDRPASRDITARLSLIPNFMCEICRGKGARGTTGQVDGDKIEQTAATDPLKILSISQNTGTGSQITLTISTEEKSLILAGAVLRPHMASVSEWSWRWSPPHYEYYLCAHDVNSQPAYLWARQLQSLRMAQLKSTVVDNAGAPSAYISNMPESVASSLDETYTLKSGLDARRFYVVGRVFEMLEILLVGQGRLQGLKNDDAYGFVRYEETTWSEVWRLVVVEVHQGFVYACAISTWPNLGTLEHGLVSSEYTIVHFPETDYRHCYSIGEYERGMKKMPIKIIPVDDEVRMKAESRLRFNKIFPIEMNNRVKDIGIVSPEWLNTFLGYCSEYR